MVTETLQAQVQGMLDRLVATGEEVGLQMAAYLDGELVVDAWAGLADEATGRPVDGKTLFTAMSTTKGFTATCLHLLAERGLVTYDAPIAAYWPEFAANGKERATVRHAPTHAVGVPHLPEGVTPEMLCDWDGMCAYLAAEAPLWEPGTLSAYHGVTFGYIIGEIVRRVDGRPIAQFSREELCAPLGIEDFYLGIPDAVVPQVATLRGDSALTAWVASLTGWARRVLPPKIVLGAVMNRPDMRRASLPFAGGIMNARAIARHYAMLAVYGELDGVRLLSPARVEEIRALQEFEPGAIQDGKPHKGLGYMLFGEPDEQGRYAFGHDGGGGSLGLADPARRLSVGVTKTLSRADGATADSIVAALQGPLRSARRKGRAAHETSARRCARQSRVDRAPRGRHMSDKRQMCPSTIFLAGDRPVVSPSTRTGVAAELTQASAALLPPIGVRHRFARKQPRMAYMHSCTGRTSR